MSRSETMELGAPVSEQSCWSKHEWVNPESGCLLW